MFHDVMSGKVTLPRVIITFFTAKNSRRAGFQMLFSVSEFIVSLAVASFLQKTHAFLDVLAACKGAMQRSAGLAVEFRKICCCFRVEVDSFAVVADYVVEVV